MLIKKASTTTLENRNMKSALYAIKKPLPIEAMKVELQMQNANPN